MKHLTLISCILLFSLNINAQKKEKTYKVLAACGQCQLGMDSPDGCKLAIQIGGKTYWVDGSSISDHGDEHAHDGMCSAVRKAKVKGTFKGNRIKVSSFEIIPEKKKKKKK